MNVISYEFEVSVSFDIFAPFQERDGLFRSQVRLLKNFASFLPNL